MEMLAPRAFECNGRDRNSRNFENCENFEFFEVLGSLGVSGVHETRYFDDSSTFWAVLKIWTFLKNGVNPNGIGGNWLKLGGIGWNLHFEDFGKSWIFLISA